MRDDPPTRGTVEFVGRFQGKRIRLAKAGGRRRILNPTRAGPPGPGRGGSAISGLPFPPWDACCLLACNHSGGCWPARSLDRSKSEHVCNNYLSYDTRARSHLIPPARYSNSKVIGFLEPFWQRDDNKLQPGSQTMVPRLGYVVDRWQVSSRHQQFYFCLAPGIRSVSYGPGIGALQAPRSGSKNRGPAKILLGV